MADPLQKQYPSAPPKAQGSNSAEGESLSGVAATLPVTAAPLIAEVPQAEQSPLRRVLHSYFSANKKQEAA